MSLITFQLSQLSATKNILRALPKNHAAQKMCCSYSIFWILMIPYQTQKSCSPRSRPDHIITPYPQSTRSIIELLHNSGPQRYSTTKSQNGELNVQQLDANYPFITHQVALLEAELKYQNQTKPVAVERKLLTAMLIGLPRPAWSIWGAASITQHDREQVQS